METVPNTHDNMHPTDRDIADALTRIDEALAAIEANRAANAAEMQALKTARARRDITDTISIIIAASWLIAVVLLAIVGTIDTLGGAR